MCGNFLASFVEYVSIHTGAAFSAAIFKPMVVSFLLWPKWKLKLLNQSCMMTTKLLFSTYSKFVAGDNGCCHVRRAYESTNVINPFILPY